VKVNPLKIDTSFFAPLLLTGTTLLARMMTQGVEQAFLSTAAEYGVKCLRLLPQCRENFTKTIVKAFTTKTASAGLAELTAILRYFLNSATHDQVFTSAPDLVVEELPAKRSRPQLPNYFDDLPLTLPSRFDAEPAAPRSFSDTSRRFLFAFQRFFLFRCGSHCAGF